MDISKAYKANDLIKEITKLENKIKWLNDIVEKSRGFERGELSIRTMDYAYYNFLLEEKHELSELTTIILDYYNNKKESLLKTIEKL